MKRRYMQTGFTVVAIALAAYAVSQWLQLHRMQAINQAVREVPASLSADAFDSSVASGSADTQPVEVRFARASALLREGNLELAEKYLGEMASDQDNSVLAEAAQFNLANGYLREALRSDTASGRFRSLVELAKQRYRDLLTENPGHWDSRFNLELALRLVPEKESYDVDERGKPIKSVSVVFPGFEDRELP